MYISGTLSNVNFTSCNVIPAADHFRAFFRLKFLPQCSHKTPLCCMPLLSCISPSTLGLLSTTSQRYTTIHPSNVNSYTAGNGEAPNTYTALASGSVKTEMQYSAKTLTPCGLRAGPDNSLRWRVKSHLRQAKSRACACTNRGERLLLVVEHGRLCSLGRAAVRDSRCVVRWL
jgi:hypothetical protein